MNTPGAEHTNECAARREPWEAFSKNWSRLGSPLRPCAEDLQRLHATWAVSLPLGVPRRQLDILLMGVTPELALYPWAAKYRLTAVDFSADMIQSIWPGDTPARTAVLGRWQAMPFADESFDLILSDNGLAVLPDAASLSEVRGEMRRLLRREGRVVMRHFARKRIQETAENVIAAAEAGEIQDFSAFKFRLLLALDAQTAGTGICLREAWEAFQRLVPDRERLAGHLRCDLEAVSTIDNYRDRTARYHFHPLAELASALEGFHFAEGPAGRYPLAEYCPVFSLSPA